MLLILSFLGIFGLFPFFLSDPSPIIGNACHSLTDSLPNLHGMGKEQLRWEKEKKVVPLVEQSQEILAWLEKLSYQ